MWPSLAHAMETELCRVTDDVSSDGMAKPRFAGRARGIATAMKLAMPMRASAHAGKVDIVMHAFIWFANRTTELADISQKVADQANLPWTTRQQWVGIMRKIRKD